MEFCRYFLLFKLSFFLEIADVRLVVIWHWINYICTRNKVIGGIYLRFDHSFWEFLCSWLLIWFGEFFLDWLFVSINLDLLLLDSFLPRTLDLTDCLEGYFIRSIYIWKRLWQIYCLKLLNKWHNISSGLLKFFAMPILTPIFFKCIHNTCFSYCLIHSWYDYFHLSQFFCLITMRDQLWFFSEELLHSFFPIIIHCFYQVHLPYEI